MTENLQEQLFTSEFRHLAIVGKEPLVNRDSILLCEALISRCQMRGITTSLITNGVNLDRLSIESARELAWLDVSLDGGPLTYGSYRRSSYPGLIRSLHSKRDNGQLKINALHVINNITLPHLDDMLQVLSDFPFRTVMFSPYLETRHSGETSVDCVPLHKILDAFSRSQRFHEATEALLLIDIFHLEEDGITERQCRDLVEQRGLAERVVVIGSDPLEYGILRLTYDALVLTPGASLHTADYVTLGVPAANSLNQVLARTMSLAS